MNRAVRKFSRPVRAVILAVLVHVAFGLLLGLSLSFKPQVIKPGIAKPVKAIVIDRSTIAQEETSKKEGEKKRKAEAEKKRKAEAEKKRKAEHLFIFGFGHDSEVPKIQILNYAKFKFV